MRSIAGESTRRAVAVCASGPAEIWLGYPDESRAESAARETAAIALCADCPIRTLCLDEALTWPEYRQYGVRGGETAATRRTEIRRRRRAESARVIAVRRRWAVAMTTEPADSAAVLGGAA